MNNKEIWTFKYEPKSVEEMVIPDNMIPVLNKVIKEQPNLLLAGGPGIGKGTFVNIFLKETGCDFIRINGSKENSIDDVRDKITSFATSMSMGIGKIKYVYINEFDFFSQPGQGSLRDLIESVQSITRFIFTCNYANKIIDPLKSRCQSIEFPNPPIDKLGRFCMGILKYEGVKEIDKKLLLTIIKKHTPDIRRIINTIQLNTIDGKLIKLVDINTDKSNQEILKSILETDLDSIRKILRSNPVDYNNLYEFLYESVGEFKSPGDAIILIANALRDNNFSSNREINFMGMICNGLKGNIF
jgi:DNA polymerase III delta prime subunit